MERLRVLGQLLGIMTNVSNNLVLMNRINQKAFYVILNQMGINLSYPEKFRIKKWYSDESGIKYNEWISNIINPLNQPSKYINGMKNLSSSFIEEVKEEQKDYNITPIKKIKNTEKEVIQQKVSLPLKMEYYTTNKFKTFFDQKLYSKFSENSSEKLQAQEKIKLSNY